MPGPKTVEFDHDWITFSTMVRFYPNKTWDQLKTYLDDKRGKLDKDEVRILAAFQTYGRYDAVVLWQAKNHELAKKFWANPITDIGAPETLVGSPSDVW